MAGVIFRNYLSKRVVKIAFTNKLGYIVPCQTITTKIQQQVYLKKQTITSPLLHCTPVFILHTNKFSHSENNKNENKEDEKKLSIFQKFKQMYRDYWYVLVPVHLATSAVWFGGFYYLAKSGVDIVGILESWNVSKTITNSLKDSSMGYIAVAYALYKLATPVRYTVTLGGTTLSINYLKKWGYIKPVPSTERLKKIYMEKRDNLMDSMRETRDELKTTADKIIDKKDNIKDDLTKSIKKIKESGEAIRNKKEDIVENISKTLKSTK